MADPPANPYSPPTTDPKPPEAHSFTDMVHHWERLRILYNLVLLAAGLIVLSVLISRDLIRPVEAIPAAFLVGLGANIAYFLGPLSELYLRSLLFHGAPLGRGRLLLFGAGLVFSLGLFVLALALGLMVPA